MKHRAELTALASGFSLIAAYFLAVAPMDARAAEPKPPATVNWQGQLLKATGSGAPDMKAVNPAQARLGAEKAAQMDALRNLLAQVKGIQVSGGKTVGDAMTSDEVKGKVDGIVRGYKVTAKRYFSDSGVEIDVEVPLSALTELFLPAAPDSEGAGLNKEGEQKHSGLIVDARGLEVVPALSPKLLDDAGKELYGVAFLGIEARKSSGVAAYATSLDEAKKSSKVGARPLVVKASKASGSNLVLMPAEAQKLTQGNNGYLAEGRVVIVAKLSSKESP